MQIAVALDGSKRRDLSFYPGDDLVLNLKAYAKDGDSEPIEVINSKFIHGYVLGPELGAEFTVPEESGREPYKIIGDVSGQTTTLAFGWLIAGQGYPEVFCWSGRGWFGCDRWLDVWGTAAENIQVKDVGQYYMSQDVEGVLQEVGARQRQFQEDLDSLEFEGADQIGFLQAGSGAVSISVQTKLQQFVDVRDYGAKADGSDATIAFKNAIATGQKVRFSGNYRITEPLFWSVDGQVIEGNGKQGQSSVYNSTNSAPLFTSSIGTGPVFKRRGSLQGLTFEGNSSTLKGVVLRGILDDGLTGDADKSCSIKDIRVTKVGSGPALEVNSWCNNIYGVELWDNYQGFKIGSEGNSFGSFGLYITGCVKEAIYLAQGAGQPSVINFYNTTAQYSGGDEYMIDIRDGYAIKFYGLYLENSTAPLGPIGVSGQAAMVGFDNVMHNLVGGTLNTPIITTNIKHCQVRDIVNLGGDIASFVKITGSLPFTKVDEYHLAAGTVVTPIDDQSTRKATIVSNWENGRIGPTRVNGLSSQNLIEYSRTDTGAIVGFMRGDGRLFFGPDSTSPSLSRAGGTLSMIYDAGIGTYRAPQFGLGATGGPLWFSGSVSPEGVSSAPPGSIYSRTTGGAATTLYVKETGTGNTGWVAK